MSFISLVYLISLAWCETPTLNNIDQQDLKDVGKELSANFTHTAVSPASSLGTIFGFEVGLIGGITATPRLERLVKEVDSSTSISSIPHANLVGIVTVPFGISVEAGLLPKMTFGDISFSNTSAALKWTFSDVFLKKVPLLDLGVRVHFSKNEVNYSQIINNSSTGNTNVNSTLDFENSVVGYHLTAGLNLPIIKPYIGFGRVNATSDLNITGSGGATIFSPSFTSSQSATVKNQGDHFFIGANINLLLFKVGFEASKIMGVERYSAKLSAGF